MKMLMTVALLISSISFASSSEEAFYQCVANQLRVINSEAYADVTAQDALSMLTIVEMSGHSDAVKAAHICHGQ